MRAAHRRPARPIGPSPGDRAFAPRKGVTLRKSRIAIVTTLLTIAAVCAGSALAAPAKSTKIIAFNASYAGAANVTVADGVSTISASGPGKGTPIGVSKLVGNGSGTADESATCQQFGGTGTITGTKGAKITFKLATGTQACADSAGDLFSVSGRATVTGGAGAYKKAKGSLKVVGVYKKSEKNFAVKFIGKLTVPA